MTMYTIFIYSILLVALGANYARAEESAYKVEGDGNLLQVTTPYGSKLFFGDPRLSQTTSYQVEIPISDLKPTDSPTRPGSTPPIDPGQMGDNNLLVTKANELYNRGKFKESLAFIEELLRREPKHVRGWVMKGSLMHAMEQKDMAKQAWKTALELDPNNSQIKTILGKYE